jgi:type II secretory pathway component GspD/PulD (secretin)
MTGKSILGDQTVQGLISLSVKDMSLEDCLERVCAPGGYSYVKVKDYYIVGRADPGSAMFQRVAESQRVKLSNVTCEQVRQMLPASMAPYVTFDKLNGVVLVTAPESSRQRALEVLKLIDQPNLQVAVEAVVFELTEEGSKQLGLDWQYQKAHVAGAVNNLVGTITYNAGSDLATYVNVTLRAILEERKGQILANPRVLVMNGMEAEIFVGQEKYFSMLNGQASSPYYQLESIKAGVMMKVLPSIGEGGQITLSLEPEVSDVVANRDLDSVDRGDIVVSPLPVVTRRRAKTVVSVQDGQTVVIGGLLRDQHRSIVDKVPLLGDIPWLGAAFRKVQDTKEQQEVIILITTRLVNRRQEIAGTVAARLGHRYVSPLDAISGHSSEANGCVSPQGR